MGSRRTWFVLKLIPFSCTFVHFEYFIFHMHSSCITQIIYIFYHYGNYFISSIGNFFFLYLLHDFLLFTWFHYFLKNQLLLLYKNPIQNLVEFPQFHPHSPKNHLNHPDHNTTTWLIWKQLRRKYFTAN